MLTITPNIHPFIVHFTIALLTVGTLAMLLGLRLKAEPVATQIRALAHWSLWIGGVFALLAGISGLFAYNSVRHDSVSHLAMQDHRAWALATIVVFVIAALLSLRAIRNGLRPSPAVAVLCVLGLGLLMSTGWRGGELVYRHGLGVMSLPNPAKHDHASGEQHEHLQADQSDAHDNHAHGHDDLSVGGQQEMPVSEGESNSKTHVHADGQSHEH